MKMTMHIDADLLGRVMKRYGFASKTETVRAGLRELERKAAFADLVERGMKATPYEMRTSVDPAYDIHRMRVAETRARYGKKPHGRTRRR